MFIYRALDIFFLIFHTSLVIFNIFGWMWKKTRIANLITLLLTGSSWLFLGLIVGVLGYCPFTDWHFRVLYRLGETDLPDAYIKYLFDRITGLDVNAKLADDVTLYVFLVALGISLFANIRDRRAGKNKRKEMAVH